MLKRYVRKTLCVIAQVMFIGYAIMQHGIMLVLAKIYQPTLAEVQQKGELIYINSLQQSVTVVYDDLLRLLCNGSGIGDGTTRIVDGHIVVILSRRLLDYDVVTQQFILWHELGHAMCDPELVTLGFRRHTKEETLSLLAAGVIGESETRANQFAQEHIGLPYMEAMCRTPKLVSAGLFNVRQLLVVGFMLCNQQYAGGYK